MLKQHFTPGYYLSPLRGNTKPMAKIYYARVDEFWRKEEKYAYLDEKQHRGNIEWQKIQPDAKYNWLTEGMDDEFEGFMPIGTKKPTFDWYYFRRKFEVLACRSGDSRRRARAHLHCARGCDSGAPGQIHRATKSNHRAANLNRGAAKLNHCAARRSQCAVKCSYCATRVE